MDANVGEQTRPGAPCFLSRYPRSRDPILNVIVSLLGGPQKRAPKRQPRQWAWMHGNSNVLTVICCYVEALLDPLCALFLVICGDVEVNPGPNEEILRLVRESNERCIKIKTNQTNLSKAVDELKAAHESVVASISGINTRLDTVEKRATTLEGYQHNLKESWQESEQRILSFASEKLGLEIAADNIERAHRIGLYVPDKKRPIVVRFSSYKTKELVQSKWWLLDDTDFYIRDNLSLATRSARKKLLEYGKGLHSSYKLRHNRLSVGEAGAVERTLQVLTEVITEREVLFVLLFVLGQW
ncbi:hypothetical protein HPB48_019010 [Haemaphysalis longicornis]|uniref:Uncharacterized protein n=1 Tax=Haemaphysalis longicornis TaxID=44386 RepID=A0A9J6GVB8_HAELO|nr:hypothetical protein HPB48_019010 [Haemaphysalis longicornis]